MNLGGLAQRFAQTVTLKRAARPVLDTVTGVFEPQAAVESDIDVTIHTLSGRDLVEVPEADRNTEMIQVYAIERLYVADDGATEADRLVWEGRTYRVTKVFDENVNGGVWMAYATLEEPTS